MTEVPELWFLIRADANATIGIGHVMRCLALAEWARDSGFKAVLCTKFPHSFLQQRLEALGGTYLLIPESEKPPGNTYAHSSWLKGNELEDAEATLAVIQKLGLPSPSFIVVDHYALGAPWEKYARKVAPIIVIDDLNDRDHCCEILVDQNYGKSLLSYTQLTPSTTKTLIGPKYALLRKEFSIENNKAHKNSEEALHILISFGGADEKNLSCWALDLLKAHEQFVTFRITIVTSSLNPNIKTITEETKSFTNVSLLIDIQNMADVMRSNDFCIGSISSTTWERFSCALPSILIVVADNQFETAESLALDSLITMIDLHSCNEAQFESELAPFLDQNFLLNNANTIKSICDGKGALRVLEEVNNILPIN